MDMSDQREAISPGISLGDFVKCLFDIRRPGGESGREGGLTLKEILRYGHFRLWLEDCDERNPQKSLNRQAAARIIHLFLRIECGLEDIADIKEAEKLADLYTCRLCANHIAQVYMRGIMQAQEIENGKYIFNHFEPVLKKEADLIISKIGALISFLK